MDIKEVIRTNPIIKTVISCATLIFPILCILFVNNGKPNAFQFVWVAFYSSVLFCFIHKSKSAKIIVCCLNGVFVIGLTLIFLMGGSEIIPGVCWNAVLPFLPNPWY
ncbi:MAG: hypothetical protein PHN80_07985 [Hespellia sp.]|nr:hypothetical protein [Hespellia sp.]